MLFALFTIAGGILIRGNIHGSPLSNVLLLALGAALASVVGTTGASMILIRPVIRANDDRAHNAHVVVFFIFLVSNIGGALTPLGDPPLFVGFLRGVDFFWTTTHHPRRDAVRDGPGARGVHGDRPVALSARGGDAGPTRRPTRRPSRSGEP